jgi:rSAM/selenodomain-associated transferase 1
MSSPAAGDALGIFAKEPLPGRVKTRLCPPFTAEDAALLYRTSLQETLAAMAGAPAELTLFYEGSAAFFRKNFPSLSLVAQGEGDLGARLERALSHLFAGGARAAALIGSDSPDLPPALVAAALAALRDNDLAVIPAADGGYVLIGARACQPEIFRNIPWSTAQVWPLTRQKAARLGLRCRVVGHWEDMDDVAALQRLIRRSPASRTARLARQLLGQENLL